MKSVRSSTESIGRFFSISVTTSEKLGALLFFMHLRAERVSFGVGAVPNSGELSCCLISSGTE